MSDIAIKKTGHRNAGAKKIGYYEKCIAYHITEKTLHLKKFGLSVTEDDGVRYLAELAVATKQKSGATPFMLEFKAKQDAANQKLKTYLSECLRNYNPQ